MTLHPIANPCVERPLKGVAPSGAAQAQRRGHRIHHLHTRIEIAAPVARVWSMLVDFASHSRWNPYVRSIEGNPEVGQSLKVFVQPPGSRGMYFRPTVIAAQTDRELRWKGKLFVPGLLDGEHYFQLEEKPAGGLVFHHGEIFSGLLVPLFRRTLDGAIRQGFVATNEALKREAEEPAVAHLKRQK